MIKFFYTFIPNFKLWRARRAYIKIRDKNIKEGVYSIPSEEKWSNNWKDLNSEGYKELNKISKEKK